jgi:hypothetical protein
MNEPDETKRSQNRANMGVEGRPAAHQSQSFWRLLLAMFRALLGKATRYQLERSS